VRKAIEKESTAQQMDIDIGTMMQQLCYLFCMY
jgi:hypothetical protein